MKKLAQWTLLATLLPAAALADDQLAVVASVPDLAALARGVVGDRGTVTAMSLGTQDPHFVDARPSLALDLSRADLLVVVGLELEIGWLPKLQVGARNGAILSGAPGYLDCSTVVRRLEVPTEKIDRSMGDVHPGGNPHYLYDPRQALPVIDAIAERLAALDPAGSDYYRARGRAERDALTAQIAGWSARLAHLRGVEVIGYHRSLAYLADWTGLKVIEHVEPKPGIPPNPGHVAKLVVKMRQARVQAILMEAHHPRTTADLLAEKGGSVVIRFDGGAAAGQSYVERIEQLVRQLEALRGRT